MSRDKKPKKQKYTDPKTGKFRHTDGDRRHRGAMSSAKDAIKHKKKMHETGLPPEAEGEANEWSEWEEFGGESDADA